MTGPRGEHGWMSPGLQNKTQIDVQTWSPPLMTCVTLTYASHLPLEGSVPSSRRQAINNINLKDWLRELNASYA